MLRFGLSRWILFFASLICLPSSMAQLVSVPIAQPVLPASDLPRTPASEIRIFNRHGQLAKKFTDRGRTIYSYDQERRTTAVSDDGRTGTYEYDERNRLKRSVWSTGEIRTYIYDEQSGALSRIENIDGSSIRIHRAYGRKPTVIVARVDGSQTAVPNFIDRVNHITTQRGTRASRRPQAIASSEGDKKCDQNACEIDSGGGRRDEGENQGNGAGGQPNNDPPPEEPENTVEVPGESCDTNPYQEGCPPENPVDWDDVADEELPSGGGGEEDWKGPDGCRRHLVEICKEDAFVAHQEGIKQCMQRLRKKETRRQCIVNEIQLYSDMLRQCEENLKCRK